MSLFLAAEDVQRLTGKVRYGAQCRVLAARGFRFLRAGVNGDGEPLVRRDDVDADGKPAQRSAVGHRWDRIASVRQLKAARGGA